MTTIRNVRMKDVIKQPYRVSSSGHYVKDVLLTPPTDAEWKEYQRNMAKVDPGKVWDGTVAALDAMEPEAREQMFEQFDKYRSKDRRKTGDAADAFLGRTANDMRTATSDINARNRAFWDNRKA